MTSSFCRTEKSKTELSSSQKGKNTFSRFSGFKVFLFIFVSAFFWSETSFAVVHSVENISEKVKGDRLSLSDVNSILGTIRGFFFDDSTGFVGIGTDSPAAKLEIEHQGSIGFEGDLSLGGIVLDQNNNNSQLGLDSNEITQKGGNLYVTSHDGGIYFRTDEDDSDTAEVQMFINAAGNVGIGNINPTTNLEVESDSFAPLKLLRTGTSGGNSISFANENGRLGAVGADEGNKLLFYVGENSSESMVIDSDGNVGVGTSAPNSKLIITHDQNVSGNSATTLTADAADNTAATYAFQARANNGTSGSASYLMSIRADGNVGIGTTSPNEALHVEGSLLVDAYNTSDPSSSGIFFREGYTGEYPANEPQPYNASITLWDGSNNGESYDGISVNGHDGVVIRTKSEDNPKLVVNSAGNVGIGTTSPETALEVEGNGTVASFTNANTSNSDTGIKIVGGRNANTAGNTAYLDLANFDENEGDDGTEFVMGRVAGGMNDFDGQTGFLQFFTNSGADLSEKMRIDKNGNVGIGTTEPNAKLEVDGSVHMGGFTESDEDEWPKFTWLRNTINDWDEGLIKQSSAKGAFGKGGFGIHFDDSKEFSLVTSKWTTVASFDGATKNAYFAGNVGIGTTEPNYLLDVNGTISGTGVAGALSDARHKNTIENLKYGLDEVLQLRPVNFMWNAEKVADHGMSGVQLGLIAQEVEGILPEVVLTAPDQSQTKSIKYSALIPPMIQAIKDLEARDRALQQQIAELRAELATLR